MRLVERHIIQPQHRFFGEIDRLCWLSKNLYNYANYMVRQSFIFDHFYRSYNDIQKILQGTEPYQALPAKVSQQVLMVLDRNWKSFLAANQAYKQHPEKFNGRPKLPKYKNTETGRNLLIYTIQALSKPQLKQGIIHPSQTKIYLRTTIETSKIKQVRIIPRLNHYVIEVIYEAELLQYELKENSIASIDIGLNNLATLTFNQAGIPPLLINGRPLKSINQYYNKVLGSLQSLLPKHQSSRRMKKLCNRREFKINDYLPYCVSIGNQYLSPSPNWHSSYWQKSDVETKNPLRFEDESKLCSDSSCSVYRNVILQSQTSRDSGNFH